MARTMSDPFAEYAKSAAEVSLKAFLDLVKELGYLERVQRKLMKRPNEARVKLEEVLKELSGTYAAIENEVNEFLKIRVPRLESDVATMEVSEKLRRLTSGQQRAEMRKAKAKCKEIWNTYNEFLKPWFTKVLNKKENEELFYLFRQLMDVDSLLSDGIDASAEWLRYEATQALSLVEKGEYEAADRRIQESKKRWAPVSDLLTDSMKRMHDLKSSFSEKSGAV
ncbi:hypothetical protein [Kocuria sp. U4B]